MGKKSYIKKGRFTKYSKFLIKKIVLFFSSTNYNSIIKNMLNRLLYFFLTLLVFPIFSIFVFLILIRENLHFLNVISIIFVFILNVIVFAKIISLRSSFGLFFKYPRPLSWKYILLRQKVFGFSSTYWMGLSICYVIFDTIRQVVNHPQDWTNSMVNNYILILTVTTAIIFLVAFEWTYWMFVLFEKTIYYLFCKKIAKDKDISFDIAKKSQPISASATFNVTNSIIVLSLFLITSIFFAKITCDQIDDYFLDSTLFNPFVLLISALLALLFLIYFIVSLNKMVFKFFKWEYDTDIKRNIPTLLLCFFVFVNIIYFVKYLATAMVYLPIDLNDPATIMLSKTLTPAGKPMFEDKFFVALVTLMDYLTFSIISATLVYIIFFIQTSKKHIVEFLEKTKNLLNNDDESYTMSKVIEKLFSKQLKNQKLGKYYSLFFYIYSLGIPFLASWIIMFLLFSDVKNGTGRFDIAVHKYQYGILAYSMLMLIFAIIQGQVQRYHRYSLTYFISKDNWVKFAKYSTIHYSIVDGCLIDIFIRGVYRLSKEYGNIEPPNSIQTFQAFLISIFVLEFLFSEISSKVEEFIIKAYDYDIDNNSKKAKIKV